MKSLKIIISTILITLLFIGCANVTPIEECVKETPYGFFGGLWHGIIVVFSFVGSVFSEDISIYAVNNNGLWYDFGFVLGIGALAGGSSKA